MHLPLLPVQVPILFVIQIASELQVVFESPEQAFWNCPEQQSASTPDLGWLSAEYPHLLSDVLHCPPLVAGWHQSVLSWNIELPRGTRHMPSQKIIPSAQLVCIPVVEVAVEYWLLVIAP